MTFHVFFVVPWGFIFAWQGAIFGGVAMSFFVAGEALGDVGVVALCKTHLQRVKSHLGERAGAR